MHKNTIDTSSDNYFISTTIGEVRHDDLMKILTEGLRTSMHKRTPIIFDFRNVEFKLTLVELYNLIKQLEINIEVMTKIVDISLVFDKQKSYEFTKFFKDTLKSSGFISVNSFNDFNEAAKHH